jgi:hypothetical protein
MSRCVALVSTALGAIAPHGPNAAAQQAQKTSAYLVAAAIPNQARDKPVEFWWQDEARVGQ